MSTIAEIQLSPTLRAAQRSVAAWLERTGADARRAAFTARAAVADLDHTDQGRLTRWLAWICHASSSQGNLAPQARIVRLDPRLGARIAAEMERLPALMQETVQHVLRSA